MKSTYKMIGSSLMALSFLFAIGAASISVQAQDRNGRRDDRYYQDQQRRDDNQRRRDRRRDGRYNDGRYNDGRYNDGYGNYGGSFDLRQTALNAGANEGIKEGRRDRSRGERYDFTDEDAYQKATKDYSSRLGDREIFRRYFRAAFQNAYADGYQGY